MRIFERGRSSKFVVFGPLISRVSVNTCGRTCWGLNHVQQGEGGELVNFFIPCSCLDSMHWSRLRNDCKREILICISRGQWNVLVFLCQEFWQVIVQQ